MTRRSLREQILRRGERSDRALSAGRERPPARNLRSSESFVLSVRAHGEDEAVGVPIAIFVVCLAGGVYASSRWLPELAPGSVGGLAFLAVCGLLGAAFAVFGLDIYGIVENFGDFGGVGGIAKRRILADGLESLMWQTGVLVALALAVYLLAPPSEDAREDAPAAESAPGSSLA